MVIRGRCVYDAVFEQSDGRRGGDVPGWLCRDVGLVETEVMCMEFDIDAVMALIARLEQEHSYECCCELARTLGYQIDGEPGCVQVHIPHSRLFGVYFSTDALINDVLDDARRLVS